MAVLSKYFEYIEIANDTYLLVNFLSGDALLASGQELESLISLKRDSLSFWKERGYIFDNGAEEEKEKERIISLASKFGGFEKIAAHTILPTYECNCRCAYCYEGAVTRKRHKLSIPQIDIIFNHINRIASSHEEQLYLTLFGGEPLLEQNIEIVEYILEKAKSKKSAITIISNAVELDRYMDIMRKYDSIIRTVQTTIDGPKEIHDRVRKLKDGTGTFDIIMDNIQLILEEDLRTEIVVRTNVDNNRSLKDIEMLERIYEKRGFLNSKRFSFYLAPIKVSYGGCQTSNCIYSLYDFIRRFKPFLLKLRNQGRIMNLNAWQQSLLKRIAKHGVFGAPALVRCGATSNRSYVFGPEGHLFACWDEVGDDSKRIGTWYPEWKTNTYGNAWRNRRFTSIPECSSCSYAFVCSGGCGAYANTRHGSLNSPACNSPSEEKAILYELAKILAPYILDEKHIVS